MIENTVTSKKAAAITSDRWHVVLASWSKRGADEPPFSREIVSEHEDRTAAVQAAAVLLRSLILSAGDRPVTERDEVFVRRPKFKSLRFSFQRKHKKS